SSYLCCRLGHNFRLLLSRLLSFFNWFWTIVFLVGCWSAEYPLVELLNQPLAIILCLYVTLLDQYRQRNWNKVRPEGNRSESDETTNHSQQQNRWETKQQRFGWREVLKQEQQHQTHKATKHRDGYATCGPHAAAVQLRFDRIGEHLNAEHPAKGRFVFV